MLSINQRKRPQEKPILPTSQIWTDSLQKCKEIHFCCLSHPVYGTLLWQPQKTDILRYKFIELPEREERKKRYVQWFPILNTLIQQLVIELPAWAKSCPSCQGFSSEQNDTFSALQALIVCQSGGLLKMQASTHWIRGPGCNLFSTPLPIPIIYIWMGTRMLDPSPLHIWDEEIVSASAADVEELSRIERKESWRWEGLSTPQMSFT